uniref:Uncharacterized protein n=1 Tax=Oryza sativa subsp. japonica TaxID=39947 RepID=Q8GVW6_ORYSJ|nr:hypothetical protein [Oryza sativa Japonica Group]BAD05287.1 hypothetical protein [Oryza sativa Japonica Group]
MVVGLVGETRINASREACICQGSRLACRAGHRSQVRLLPDLLARTVKEAATKGDEGEEGVEGPASTAASESEDSGCGAQTEIRSTEGQLAELAPTRRHPASVRAQLGEPAPAATRRQLRQVATAPDPSPNPAAAPDPPSNPAAEQIPPWRTGSGLHGAGSGRRRALLLVASTKPELLSCRRPIRFDHERGRGSPAAAVLAAAWLHRRRLGRRLGWGVEEKGGGGAACSLPTSPPGHSDRATLWARR